MKATKLNKRLVIEATNEKCIRHIHFVFDDADFLVIMVQKLWHFALLNNTSKFILTVDTKVCFKTVKNSEKLSCPVKASSFDQTRQN